MSIPSLTAKPSDRPALIYALVDPAERDAFYVGVTTRPWHRRLGSHVHDARHTPDRDARTRRLAGILDAGDRPLMFVLETVPRDGWVEAEQFWIEYLRFLGCDLTNRGTGGPGATGARQSDTAKARRRVAAVGRDLSHLRSDAVREKAASTMRGRPGRQWTDEQRAAKSAQQIGQKRGPHTQETREKISATKRMRALVS